MRVDFCRDEVILSRPEYRDLVGDNQRLAARSAELEKVNAELGEAVNHNAAEVQRTLERCHKLEDRLGKVVCHRDELIDQLVPLRRAQERRDEIARHAALLEQAAESLAKQYRQLEASFSAAVKERDKALEQRDHMDAVNGKLSDECVRANRLVDQLRRENCGLHGQILSLKNQLAFAHVRR
jgi:chromosome segregation ATPase